MARRKINQGVRGTSKARHFAGEFEARMEREEQKDNSKVYWKML